MATSPALDVPPEEPPHKRLKTANGLPSTSSSPGPAPTLLPDLAEQLDQEERKKYIKGKAFNNYIRLELL